MEAAIPASLALAELGIPHRVFRHAGVVTTLEQAALERGQRPGQVVRSIVFRIGPERFVMALVAGPRQISWKKLRSHMGQARLTMASAEEVLQVTGYVIGTVSPFRLSQPMGILLDSRVLEEAEISIGSGAANTGIILTSKDLLRALPEAQLVDLV